MQKAKKRPGILVSFEGTEGSGKSTLIGQLGNHLNKAGIKTIQTREPGGDPTAEKIRELILHSAMHPWTELFLYEAARAQHLNSVLLPNLLKGNVILCDRFTDSTLAYQAYARKLPWDKVKTLNQLATFGIQPDLTVFLDINPKIGLARANSPNRFEAEGIEFQKKVRAGFLKAKRECPKRWFTIKVKSETPEELAKIVFDKLLKEFSLKPRSSQ